MWLAKHEWLPVLTWNHAHPPFPMLVIWRSLSWFKQWIAASIVCLVIHWYSQRSKRIPLDAMLLPTTTNKHSLIARSRALLWAKVFGKQLSIHPLPSTQRSQRTCSSRHITLRDFFNWPLFKRSTGASKSDPSTLGSMLRAITCIFLMNVFVKCSRSAFAWHSGPQTICFLGNFPPSYDLSNTGHTCDAFRSQRRA